MTYDGNSEGSGWLEVYDLEISGFQGNAIRIASLSDDDRVTIVNTSLHDNVFSGISSVDIPTGTLGRFDIRNNYIYGNGSIAILIGGPTGAVPSTSRSTISNNIIGRSPLGAAAANLGAGIQLGRGVARFDVTSNNIENVTVSGEDGIRLLSTAGTANKLTGNTFRNINADGLLINLEGPNDLPNGETPNDGGDGDSGPNALLNKPVLYSELAELSSNWVIQFDVDFGGSANYSFDFYRYTASSNTWAPVTPYTPATNVGTQRITAVFVASTFAVGDVIAAIAYGGGSGNENTSEFSNAITLDAAAPNVSDVRLDSTSWSSTSLNYSYAAIQGAGGNYLKPIYTKDINQLQVVFSENVVPATLNNTNVKLYGSYGAAITLPTPTLTSGSRIATWTLANALGAGKYRLEITPSVIDYANKGLDGEWVNYANSGVNNVRTYDYYVDDVLNSNNSFPSGNSIPGGTFGFDFSILPGDYNQDGVVRNSGPANDKNSIGDGDGDGNAGTAADLALVDTIVNSGVGIELPLRARDGDYRRDAGGDNDIVGPEDYTVWRNSYGKTLDGETDGYLEADGNGNGIVDTVDYNVWRNNVGLQSVWAGASGSGSGSGASLPIFDPFNVPRVANVIVSGSLSLHAPFSFDTVDGSGQQLTTVPVGGADTISIVFTEDVNVQADHLQLVGLRTANQPAMADFTYDFMTMTATWRFTGWVLGDQYALMLSDAVTDIEGNHLDGDWKNPISRATINASISTFPSGDGYAGGQFQFVMTLLPGDADLNGIVNTLDYAIFGSHYGMTNALFTMGDSNGDGQVSYAGDGSLMYANWNLNLSGPVTILADLNGDMTVDAVDEAIISDHLGMANPTQADGDLNHNGQVWLDDLDLMFAQYGVKLTLLS